MSKKYFGLLAAVLLFIGLEAGCARGVEETGSPAATPSTPAVMSSGSGSYIDVPQPTELVDRFSYALGYLQIDSLISQGIDISPRFYAAAMDAAINGTEPMFTYQEMNAILMEYQELLYARQEEQFNASATLNLEAAQAYLAENGTREGVVTTESGLQYEVMNEGTGSRPTAEDVVTVHYSGTLIDGTVFDSSYMRGTPATFPLNGVIPGWTEGVQLMSVGSTYRFFIPPDLGYGDIGAGDFIGPNELLIFDVELLEIEAQE